MKNILPRFAPAFAITVIVSAMTVPCASPLRVAAEEGSPYDVKTSPAPETATPAQDDLVDLSPGDRVIRQAIDQLERHQSVSASLRHQCRLGEHAFSGTGRYWQHGSGDAMRVRMELAFLGQNIRLTQVSDGRFLWTDEQLPTQRKVSRVDLRQVRNAVVATGASPAPVQPGKASWSPLNPDFSAHAGGLPSLLSSLRHSFAFLPPQAMRLALEKPEDGQAPTIPVFAVVGHWKAERLEEFLVDVGASPSAADANPSEPLLTAAIYAQRLAALPERIPQEVLVLIGQADSFPYWIEYRRLETPITSGEKGAGIPYQLSTSPMVVLELSSVYFNRKIPTGRFDYSPGDFEWVDQTAQRIDLLRR